MLPIMHQGLLKDGAEERHHISMDFGKDGEEVKCAVCLHRRGNVPTALKRETGQRLKAWWRTVDKVI